MTSLPLEAAIGPDPSRRVQIVDALRGLALFGMFVYHFAWDLLFVGMIHVDVGGDPGWRFYARVIASTFLGLAGVSLVLAHHRGFDAAAYGVRLAKIAAAAAAVSIVTWIAALWIGVPDIFIYFGILHSILAASLAGVLFLRLPWPAILFAVVFCYAAPVYLRADYFSEPWWWWLGLSTFIRPTVDYVPVLPWFGATLLGILAGRLVIAHRPAVAALNWQPASPLGRGLVTMGRWSLLIYLVHQPFLFGIANLVAALSQ